MPVSTTTGFSVIDTYNFIREDMQIADKDFEDFDSLDDQQGIPQFSSSSSPFPTTTKQTTPPSLKTTTETNCSQQVCYSPSPRGAASPCYHPSSPSPAPHSPCPPSSTQGQTQLGLGAPIPTPTITDQQLQSLLEQNIQLGASFLEELMSPPFATTTSSLLTPVQPTPVLSSSPPPLTTTTRSSYVAEAAGAGCTVVQTSGGDAVGTGDQQLTDSMDVSELYDLDRHSFYDDAADAKVKDAGLYSDWVVGGGDLGVKAEAVPTLTDSLVGPSLTELGPVAGSEQEDLLTAFDSLRRDIVLDCKQLNISPDPKAWSGEDSRSWVAYMLDKGQGSDDCSTSLALPGPVLCQKSRDDFLWVSPSSGGFLHEQLQLWVALADLPALPSKPQQSQQQQQQQLSFSTLTPVTADFPLTSSPPQSGSAGLSHLSHLPPSVSPAPSTDSAYSSHESSLSSSSSSFSDADMMLWCQEGSEEELFPDSFANLTPATQPQPTISTTPTRTTTPTPNSTSSPPSRPQQGAGGRPGKQIRLWEFLKELLHDNDPGMKWLDRPRGIFKIEDSNRVARLWGDRKNHPAMNYDKLSRSVRQYYKKGIIKKTTQTRRLVYQFCERYL